MTDPIAPVVQCCGKCRNWNADPNDKMTPLGFGLCAHLPVHRYLSRATRCALNPSRFEEAA